MANNREHPTSTTGRLDRAWVRFASQAFNLAPRPSDPPRARSGGPDPDHVLVIGDAPAAGFGVTTHQLGIPGQLTRALSQLTGRGAEVDLIVDPGMSAEAAARRIPDLDLDRYDAIVLMLGSTDALRLKSCRRWSEQFAELLRRVRVKTPLTSPIVVAGIPLVGRNVVPNPLLASILDRNAERLNRATRDLVGGFSKTEYLTLPSATHRGGRADRGADRFEQWAALIATRLLPSLDELASPRLGSARWLRSQPPVETVRQAALDRMGLVDSEPDPEIDRIAKLASVMFGTEFAAVELIDRERAWLKANVGYGELDELPRGDSFCNVTIQRPGGLVIGDARNHPRFAQLPSVKEQDGLRFYAGYPIHSPDGQRIGALCVFDSAQRDADSFDITGLRNLALLIEHRLHHGSVRVEQQDF